MTPSEQPRWGEGPSTNGRRPAPAPGPRSPHPPRPAVRRDPPAEPGEADEREVTEAEADRYGWTAVGLGAVGLVLLGPILGVVTGVLAAESGRRARAAGSSMLLPLTGLLLALADGALWFTVHVVGGPGVNLLMW